MSQTESGAGLSHATSNEELISLAVVDAVAEAEGVDPTDLAPLYYAIDPSALDALVKPPFDEEGEPSGEVQFSYHGYLITVTSDGNVHLDDRNR